MRNVYEEVRRRELGRCFLCEKPGDEVHHIVSRSLFTKKMLGRDDAKNLCLLCRQCHHDSHTRKARQAILAEMQEKHGYEYSSRPWEKYAQG